jgi:hypothetical protein
MDEYKEGMAVVCEAECKTKLMMPDKQDLNDNMKHEDNSSLIKFVGVGSALLIGEIILTGLIMLIWVGLKMITLFSN